jgi:hypothetical protein
MPHTLAMFRIPTGLRARIEDGAIVVEPLSPCSLGGPSLGMAVDVFDDNAKPLRGAVGEYVFTDVSPFFAEQARQAARAVLPNATETRIVVTGNYRAWRHFIAMRATEHADVEIRALAVECLRQLQGLAPSVFSDFAISELPDGSAIAASPYTWES